MGFNSAAREKMNIDSCNKPDFLSGSSNKELARVLAEGDDNAVELLRADYLEKYPDQIEGIEALFGLRQMLRDEEQIKEIRRTGKTHSEKARSLFRSLTEYNFLLTNFICSNSGDKPFLVNFWSVAKNIARRRDTNIGALQRGITTQAATFKIFERVGLRPKLSHPAEDAFHAIDLWTDEGNPVQIKGGHVSEPIFIKTNLMTFPGVEVNGKDAANENKFYHLSSEMFARLQSFRAKVSRYKEIARKNISAYFVVIPAEEIDDVTGEPSPELIKKISEKFRAFAADV